VDTLSKGEEEKKIPEGGFDEEREEMW